MKSDRKIIAQLVQRRVKLGLSQESLARKIGIARPTLARFEAYRRTSPNLHTVQRYADAVGAEIAVLDAGQGARTAIVTLPEQHFGLQADDVIAEFRFGDNCSGVTAFSDRVYVVGGAEEMPLADAREFALALLAAVLTAEGATNA